MGAAHILPLPRRTPRLPTQGRTVGNCPGWLPCSTYTLDKSHRSHGLSNTIRSHSTQPSHVVLLSLHSVKIPGLQRVHGPTSIWKTATIRPLLRDLPSGNILLGTLHKTILCMVSAQDMQGGKIPRGSQLPSGTSCHGHCRAHPTSDKTPTPSLAAYDRPRWEKRQDPQTGASKDER